MRRELYSDRPQGQTASWLPMRPYSQSSSILREKSDEGRVLAPSHRLLPKFPPRSSFSALSNVFSAPRTRTLRNAQPSEVPWPSGPQSTVVSRGLRHVFGFSPAQTLVVELVSWPRMLYFYRSLIGAGISTASATGPCQSFT
jgi:hypothetical protein